MLLPIRSDSPLRSTPWMNWAIIAANAVVFAVEKRQPNLVTQYVLNPRDPHVVNFLTYAFLHGGWSHIIGNMLFLYIFGNNVNDKMGHVGYLAFYLAGAVFSGCGYVLFSVPPVLGASGAVSAVTGAYLVLFPRSSITIVYFFLFIGSADIPSLWFILLYFAKDVLGASGSDILGGEQVAYASHVSGTLFGAAVCFALLLANLLPRDQFDMLALASRWNRRRQYRGMVDRGYDPFGYTPPQSPRSGAMPADAMPAAPNPRQLKIQALRLAASEALARHDLPAAAEAYLQLQAIDADQALPRQAQLEVANQLASQQRYADAATAYELFLRHYPKFGQIEQVELMLGLIYARYLERYPAAKQFLLRALARLHGDREIEMARAELTRIEPLVGTVPSDGGIIPSPPAPSGRGLG